MKCISCEEDQTKIPYKCPQCRSPYCSVKCFKQHKQDCANERPESSPPSNTTVIASEPLQSLPNPVETPNSKTFVEPESPGHNPLFESIWVNRRVQELCQYEGVQKILKLIVEISNNPRISGEQDTEGRKLVALKKIQELRKGGREANYAIEEMITTVHKLWEAETIS